MPKPDGSKPDELKPNHGAARAAPTMTRAAARDHPGPRPASLFGYPDGVASSDVEPRTRLLAVSAVGAFAAILVAKLLAPGDLWDQTQPRTIAYTADMLARGGRSWLLAQDAQGTFATKPPLYNWLAVPWVWLTGKGVELGHRVPSILAAAAIAFLLVRWGERLRRGAGWLAALAWIAVFPTLKLAYLARPDMLLCLATLVGWRAATDLVLDARVGRPARWTHAALFWLSFALAAWTKGAAAAILPAYGAVAAWSMTGSPSTLLRFRPFTLGLAGGALALAWYAVAAAWEPAHFRETLVYGEVIGRMSGNGPEGGHEGPLKIVTGLPVMGLYFIARFAPWSIAAILGGLALAARTSGSARWRRPDPADGHDAGPVLWAAVLWTLTVILLFSLSSGKRADYIAPVYGPAALVAAWWMLAHRDSPVRRRVAVAPVVAALTLAVHIAVDQSGTILPRAAMVRLDTIVERAMAERRADPTTPLVVLAPQLPHVAVLCGDPAPCENTVERLRDEIKRHGKAYVLLGTKGTPEPLRSLLASGRARECWTIDIPDDAAKAQITHPVRFLAVDTIDGATGDRATSARE